MKSETFRSTFILTKQNWSRTVDVALSTFGLVCSHTHSDNFAHAKQIKQTSRAPRCTDDNIGRVSERSATERYRFSRVIAAILLAGALNFRTAGYRKYHTQCSLEETTKTLMQYVNYFEIRKSL